MANTFTALHCHIVFSTKNRETWIRPDIEQRVWSYIGGIACQNGLKSLAIGGIENHVHLLLGIPSNASVSKTVQLVKGGSSSWIKETFAGFNGFAWQDGYAAFSVSKSHVPEVISYIGSQREHHRTKTFEEEYRAFMVKHEIPFEERYLLDGNFAG
jgi:REP element-mobilizing transposase RayT